MKYYHSHRNNIIFDGTLLLGDKRVLFQVVKNSIKVAGIQSINSVVWLKLIRNVHAVGGKHKCTVTATVLHKYLPFFTLRVSAHFACH